MATHTTSSIRFHALTAAAALALLAGCSSNDDGDDSATPTAAQTPAPCERECLEGFVDRYLEALVAHDPSRLPLAPNVTFAENNQRLSVGTGTWRTVTGLGTYRHYFADVAAGQAGMIGVVEERGTKVIYDLRLAIVNGMITEIEALIARDPNGAALYEQHRVPHPKFLETVPPAERLGRAELTAVADKYLSGMQRNDPNGDYSFFHDECDRWEHARRTTNNDPEAYGHSTNTVFVTLNCRKQFETGFLGFVTRIRDRRYVLIDEERQTVFAFAFLDHEGTIREIPLSNGTTFVVPPYFSSPRTLLVGEAWRIEDSKLRQIEMTLSEFPYGMRPAFASGDDWLARDAAARSRPAAALPSSSDCDRACLTRLGDDVLAALVARAPGQLPLAADVIYTENGQRLNPGDGLWGTATAAGAYRVPAVDAASGTVGLLAAIVETDVPGLVALRVGMDGGLVTSIDATVFRQETVGERGGTVTLFAPRPAQPLDPAVYTATPAAFVAPTPAVLPPSELAAVAASFYAAVEARDASRALLADGCQRRENGTTTSCTEPLTSGYFGAVERVRGTRTLVADPATGLVLDVAYLDVPNDPSAGAAPGYSTPGPYTLMAAQLYKVQDGKIAVIEAVSRPVPYGTGP